MGGTCFVYMCMVAIAKKHLFFPDSVISCQKYTGVLTSPVKPVTKKSQTYVIMSKVHVCV